MLLYSSVSFEMFRWRHWNFVILLMFRFSFLGNLNVSSISTETKRNFDPWVGFHAIAKMFPLRNCSIILIETQGLLCFALLCFGSGNQYNACLLNNLKISEINHFWLVSGNYKPRMKSLNSIRSLEKNIRHKPGAEEKKFIWYLENI